MKSIKANILEITVFISGAVVMVFEIVGSRIVAPFFGTSIFIWTSLIGVILASLSIGYWQGGKLADKGANLKTLARILLIASILLALVTIGKDFVLATLQATFSDLRLNSFLAALVLFTGPSILLGMVSPYAIRLKIDKVETSGSTVGKLYAISTVGSIVGTFMAGFVLIPLIGSTKILSMLSLALIGLAIVLMGFKFAFDKTVMVMMLILACLGFVMPANGLLNIDSQYSNLRVFDAEADSSGNVIRTMWIDNSVGSSAYTDSDELVYDYLKFYHLVRHFTPGFESALMIGGAGYSFPKVYVNTYPDATIDVVEIDPALTKVAEKLFNLKPNKRLQIHHEDGRTFLNRNTQDYDVIFGDAFKSLCSLPYQLTTVEAVRLMHQSLERDGVVIVNILSTLAGESSQFLQAEMATYQSVFPQVYLFPVDQPHDSLALQNIMLVALKTETVPLFNSNDHEIQAFLDHLHEAPFSTNLPVLTDDFAPVEYYINKAL